VSLCEQIAQREEVAKRLGHLLALDDEVLGVQPGAHKQPTGCSLALGDFILVVREDVVDRTRVDVEALAQ
jgi:hypothetical protein